MPYLMERLASFGNLGSDDLAATATALTARKLAAALERNDFLESSDRLSSQPVLCLQLGYPPEMTFVAGDHPKPVREGDRRYAHVGVADGSAQPLQLSPDLTVTLGRHGVESEYRQIG